jgi:hypothetical protein
LWFFMLFLSFNKLAIYVSKACVFQNIHINIFLCFIKEHHCQACKFSIFSFSLFLQAKHVCPWFFFHFCFLFFAFIFVFNFFLSWNKWKKSIAKTNKYNIG